MIRFQVVAFLFGALLCAPLTISGQDSLPPIEEVSIGETPNVHLSGSLFLAGQPTEGDIAVLKEKGVKRVISLRPDGELDWDEAAALDAAGIDFVVVPFRKPDSLTTTVFDDVRKLLQDPTPTFLHCGSANRVGAVWVTHRVLDQGVPMDIAMKEATDVGLKSSEYERRARDYIIDRLEQKSVRPGINDRFITNELDLDEWLGRFEVESREVFAGRKAIIEAIGIKSDSRIADIGAGTGLFTRLFAEATKADGWVFAVDIAPQFIEHIRRQADDDRLANVSTVLCPYNSISLPPESVDIVFTCDTYHHFEYPYRTLTSIHRALRPGGSLILIDFDRIPGKSREFILGHVRADKGVFRREIESVGFDFVEEVEIDELKENYFLRFKKK